MTQSRGLPGLDWVRGYTAATLANDLLAAAVVTVMLVPQSLAYAMLAGLPPQVGLYASIAPLVAYALMGTSRTLAVGPVAVLSLMTATAATSVAAPGTPAYREAALVLALLSGAILLAMGLLRLGFLASLLSHPVVSAFVSASAVLIALSQLRHLLGLPAGGREEAWAMARHVATHLEQTNPATLAVGGLALVVLAFARTRAAPLLCRLGLKDRAADMLARATPAITVAFAILAVEAFDLRAQGVATVGFIPAGLPPLTWPSRAADMVEHLLLPAFLMALVGFVESVSVAQTLAARRRQVVVPDRELLALGAANLAAGVTGGYPVTGGFARSVVNFDAGAETPAAGAFAALGILVATLLLTPALAPLPHAVLAATIVVAVVALVDLEVPRRLWAWSKADFAAWAATAAATLAVGVEAGVVAGVVVTLVVTLARAARPHVAIVGQVPGTQHYRNIHRHAVVTNPEILSLRIDESLTHLNARVIEDLVLQEVAARPQLRHVILMASGINAIDATGLEMLETLNRRLGEARVRLHLSEVKGPVMDRLQKTEFLQHLSGEVFMSQHEAVTTLGARRAGGAVGGAPAADPTLARDWV
ncbi:MAG: sulfate permease [Sphingomonadaceae bacterium]|uniref:SulP family inorganic anion transporter n=1 Tax=Thermaurantiacus sp. TaxID=2820283 RepID=UPI00298F28A0|nr:sulfate permease [Thermaurantiacus sp.]MCS6986150.1 sulfate permease [Sphingomonadaceae bacterium]MDW8414624.1 sulfate permease [Thermaurantiacus sp.]